MSEAGGQSGLGGLGGLGGPGEGPQRAGYFDVDDAAATAGNRAYWSGHATEYLSEFGDFLGEAEFRWCPEGLLESDAAILGPVGDLRGQRLLEVGAGAAQCARWLAGRGVHVIATDFAPGMVEAARALNRRTGIDVPVQVADARSLPFEDATFDQVFTAFGAIPFVADARQVHREAARVLRPGGYWTYATTHPVRWAFPDDPEGLTVTRSYFDRTPYAETSAEGTYAEFHRTLGDHVRDLVGSGFTIVDVIEPEWSPGNTHVWGGWGPVRGELLPGTIIIRSRLAG